jgi:hypothetical protein
MLADGMSHGSTMVLRLIQADTETALDDEAATHRFPHDAESDESYGHILYKK